MPICLLCNGKGTYWVDWAEDYAPCLGCKEGVVSEATARKQQKAEKRSRRKMLRNRVKWNTYPCYRIQVQRQFHNDWDVVHRIEWNTVRVVETLAYGLYLVYKLNKEAEEWDYTPYRLVSPKMRVLHWTGNNWEAREGEEAYGVITHSMPWER